MPDEQRTANNSQTYVVYANEFSYETIEQENGQARLPRFRQRDHQIQVTEVVGKLIEVESLAVGLAAAAQIERIHGKTLSHELFGRPDVISAV